MRRRSDKLSVGQRSQSKELSFSLTLPLIKHFHLILRHLINYESICIYKGNTVLNISYNDGSTHNYYISGLWTATIPVYIES